MSTRLDDMKTICGGSETTNAWDCTRNRSACTVGEGRYEPRRGMGRCECGLNARSTRREEKVGTANLSSGPRGSGARTWMRTWPAQWSPRRCRPAAPCHPGSRPVSYTHLRAHETRHDLV